MLAGSVRLAVPALDGSEHLTASAPPVGGSDRLEVVGRRLDPSARAGDESEPVLRVYLTSSVTDLASVRERFLPVFVGPFESDSPQVDGPDVAECIGHPILSPISRLIARLASRYSRA